MRILFDTNVLLDVILRRVPFFDESANVWNLAVEHAIDGVVSVQSLKDVFYFCNKLRGREDAFGVVEMLSGILNVIDAASQDSFEALRADAPDYEDGLLVASARRNGIDGIVTRDMEGFVDSPIIVFKPKDICRYVD